MSSLKADFDELRERIRQGRGLGAASFEPIFYLIFAPEKIIEIKRQTLAWLARLRQDGWEAQQFSIVQEIAAIHQTDPRRALWLMADRQKPFDWRRTNESLANALTSNNALQNRLEAKLQELQDQKNGLLLVTDLEALHPYLRIGSIESQLQGQFRVPTIFLYPGERVGKTSLKFLGFYPPDGNYRSVHVGG